VSYNSAIAIAGLALLSPTVAQSAQSPRYFACEAEANFVDDGRIGVQRTIDSKGESPDEILASWEFSNLPSSRRVFFYTGNWNDMPDAGSMTFILRGDFTGPTQIRIGLCKKDYCWDSAVVGNFSVNGFPPEISINWGVILALAKGNNNLVVQAVDETRHVVAEESFDRGLIIRTDKNLRDLLERTQILARTPVAACSDGDAVMTTPYYRRPITSIDDRAVRQ
jgi:hypothetical protein